MNRIVSGLMGTLVISAGVIQAFGEVNGPLESSKTESNCVFAEVCEGSTPTSARQSLEVMSGSETALPPLTSKSQGNLFSVGSQNTAAYNKRASAELVSHEVEEPKETGFDRFLEDWYTPTIAIWNSKTPVIGKPLGVIAGILNTAAFPVFVAGFAVVLVLSLFIGDRGSGSGRGSMSGTGI